MERNLPRVVDERVWLLGQVTLMSDAADLPCERYERLLILSSRRR